MCWQSLSSYRLTTEQSSGFVKLVKGFAYAEEFTCNPPTVFMLAITALQTGFFVYLSVHLSDAHGLEITWDGPVPYCSVLIYNPYRRWEAWRYLTYMQVQCLPNYEKADQHSKFKQNLRNLILEGLFILP